MARWKKLWRIITEGSMPIPPFQNEAVARLKRLSRKVFIPGRLHFHSRLNSRNANPKSKDFPSRPPKPCMSHDRYAGAWKFRIRKSCLKAKTRPMALRRGVGEHGWTNCPARTINSKSWRGRKLRARISSCAGLTLLFKVYGMSSKGGF